MSQLQQQFEREMEIHWCNDQGEPDIDYVNWLEDKVEKFSSTNTGSPKLPTYGEVVNEVFGDGGVRNVPGQEANSVRHAYDFICRQLRAGA